MALWLDIVRLAIPVRRRWAKRGFIGEEVERDSFHRTSSADPTRRLQRRNVLNFAAEFSLKKLHQEAVVQMILGTIFGGKQRTLLCVKQRRLRNVKVSSGSCTIRRLRTAFCGVSCRPSSKKSNSNPRK